MQGFFRIFDMHMDKEGGVDKAYLSFQKVLERDYILQIFKETKPGKLKWKTIS